MVRVSVQSIFIWRHPIFPLRTNIAEVGLFEFKVAEQFMIRLNERFSLFC